MRDIVLEQARRAIDVMPIFGAIKSGISSYINNDVLRLTVYFIVIQYFYATDCTQNKYTSSGTVVGALRPTVHRVHPNVYWVYGAVFIL